MVVLFGQSGCWPKPATIAVRSWPRQRTLAEPWSASGSVEHKQCLDSGLSGHTSVWQPCEFSSYWSNTDSIPFIDWAYWQQRILLSKLLFKVGEQEKEKSPLNLSQFKRSVGIKELWKASILFEGWKLHIKHKWKESLSQAWRTSTSLNFPDSAMIELNQPF